MTYERNLTIDLLRTISATMVVFFLLNESIPYVQNFYRDLVKLGHIGVPIFFVISGYCILFLPKIVKMVLNLLGVDFLEYILPIGLVFLSPYLLLCFKK